MAESGAVTVCRLVADDWQVYRAIRLAMLQESPSAFGSTHADAASFDERLWRQRLTDGAVLLARVGDVPAGSAMYSEYGTTDAADANLFGMWVDPAFRRKRVGRALLSSVVAFAREAGKRRLLLHVMADNAEAKVFYERAGFAFTGQRPSHPDDGSAELEMELRIELEDTSAEPSADGALAAPE